MRMRTQLIIEDAVLQKIDEIAGEKHRRAATIDKALREFIEREEKKTPAKAAPVKAKTQKVSAARR